MLFQYVKIKKAENFTDKGKMMKEFVEMRDVRKIYRMGEVEIAAADGIDFR